MTVEELTSQINALYHKSQNEGLTEEEKTLQDSLRKEYIANIRRNLKSQLDNIDVVDENGNITPLKKQD